MAVSGDLAVQIGQAIGTIIAIIIAVVRVTGQANKVVVSSTETAEKLADMTREGLSISREHGRILGELVRVVADVAETQKRMAWEQTGTKEILNRLQIEAEAAKLHNAAIMAGWGSSSAEFAKMVAEDTADEIERRRRIAKD